MDKQIRTLDGDLKRLEAEASDASPLSGQKKAGRKASPATPSWRAFGCGMGAHVIDGCREARQDMPVDPNEPTYCICHQVSYGEMIGCDNPECPTEWFHFGCVSLVSKPKGKWFCPGCAPAHDRK